METAPLEYHKSLVLPSIDVMATYVAEVL